MKKRLISLILVISMAFSLVISLIGCSKDGDESSESASTNDNTSDTGNEPDVKTVELLEIDYNDMAIVGNSLKDFSRLFDEQKTSGDPKNGNIKYPSSIVPSYDADNDGDIDGEDLDTVFEVTLDFKVKYYIDSVYFYYTNEGKSITVEAGTPFNYEVSKTSQSQTITWGVTELKDTYRYLNFKFKNSEAPNEILIYGYAEEEKKEQTLKHTPTDFDEFLGINGNRADMVDYLDCVNYFRDYFTWAWAYDSSLYPKPATTFSGLHSSRYDIFYKNLKSKNINIVPCFQWNANCMPRFENADAYLPESYVMYGEFVYQAALRYGNNPEKTKDDVVLQKSSTKGFNRDLISWIELGNEPNGEGNDGFNPYELAALTSCAYDGHNSTITSESGSGVGIKNADPNIKVAMSGLAGIGTRYIKAMAFWLTNNRYDKTLAIDAFNVHTYCKKEIKYNGYSIWIGVCPEIGKITDEVKKLVEFRDEYYPETEVWVTEFGWDTNQSYETENSAHAYGPYTAREVQAMWLVRAYFMFAEAGVDRAAMYMCRDTGPEETTVGKYGTSGVIDSTGHKKDSYYYIATLKSTMSDMHFAEVIDSGNENVWIYRFENGEGKSCYAVWCPSMDNVRVDNFRLKIDGNSAVITEFANEEVAGISSDLTVDNGYVTVNVSEKPILVFSSNN